MPKDPPPPSATVVPPALLNAVVPSQTLGEAGQSLWDRIQREYGIEDAAGVEILSQICLAADRAAALADAVTRDGVMVQTKDGPRPHLGIRAALSVQTFIVRSLRELGLTTQSVKPVGRPAGLPVMEDFDANRSPSYRSAHSR